MVIKIGLVIALVELIIGIITVALLVGERL
jgi:hypothetical protein